MGNLNVAMETVSQPAGNVTTMMTVETTATRKTVQKLHVRDFNATTETVLHQVGNVTATTTVVITVMNRMVVMLVYTKAT